MPRVMLNEVKHLKMSLREILPSLRIVRMTLADKFAFLDNCYIIT